MAELGFLDDPGDRLGMLDAQELRAARVVLDIGVHLDLPIPAGAATGDRLDLRRRPGVPPRARGHGGRDAGRRAAPLPRLARAGAGLQGRRAGLARPAGSRPSCAAGADFDLKAWHRAALDLGPLGLAPLAAELARM